MSLQQKLKPLVISALAVCTLVGCGSGDVPNEEVEEEDDVSIDAMAEYGCNSINVYSPGEYIADETVPNFEKKFNAHVNYVTFDSNEMLYTKLLGGSEYDVLVPSDYMIERLMQEDMLQKIDKAAITNIGNIDSDVLEMQKVFDPELEYAVPYFYGSVGLVYNKQAVDEAVIKEQGWDILHNPDYKGRVYAYDSQRDMFMIALKALGYSMNTSDEKEIQAAYEWLLEMNKIIEPSYVTDEVIDSMVNGDMDIAIMYSGDAAYVISENSDMAYIEPEQGTNVWVDAMVIPANSACPALANQYINYVTGNEVAEANSQYVGYTSPNTEVREYLSGEEGDYFENSAYLPRSGFANDEVFRFNEKMTKQLNELYTKVKMSIN